MAQNKVDAKWHCPKGWAEHRFDVGDAPGHSYLIAQGACNATAGDSSFAQKTDGWPEFQERWPPPFNFHGREDITMDNGDKLYDTYEGSASSDITKPFCNKWKVVNGAGKGIKGSGICSGKFNADGSIGIACIGTYALGN
jgi:hypothetical protein